jgi:hypothetical protein
MEAIYVEGTIFAAEECVPPDQEPCFRANISHFGFRKNLSFTHTTKRERERVSESESERERERKKRKKAKENE